MAIPCLITVRTGSSRLKNKCLLPFGSGNVLEHVIRRVKNAGFHSIVCTSDSINDDVIESIANNESVDVFRGCEMDKLRRWRDCCRYFQIEKMHSIDADDPFFSAPMVEWSFSYLDQGYDLIEPTISSNEGNASVGYSLTSKLLELACDGYEEGKDSEMVAGFLKEVEGIRSIILPETGICSRIKARLTLDYEEDYWLLRSVVNILGQQPSRNEVDKLFIKNPDLYAINWFKNDDWKSRQLKKTLLADSVS